MIFGDDPRRINEREDPLGLHTYTMVPDIWAIMQSGNLYMYTMHNPVFFNDSSGLFAIPAAIAFVPLAAAFLVTFTAALLLDQNFHNAFNTAIADLSDRIQSFAQRFGRSETQVKNDLRDLAGGTTPGNPPPEDPDRPNLGRKMNNRDANEWAQRNGFRNAEDFKASEVRGSGGRFNIRVEKGTRRIWLEGIQNNKLIRTDFFFN